MWNCLGKISRQVWLGRVGYELNLKKKEGFSKTEEESLFQTRRIPL
jgi:hypothetical protein